MRAWWRRTWQPRIRQRLWFPGWKPKLSLPMEWAWPRRKKKRSEPE